MIFNPFTFNQYFKLFPLWVTSISTFYSDWQNAVMLTIGQRIIYWNPATPINLRIPILPCIGYVFVIIIVRTEYSVYACIQINKHTVFVLMNHNFINEI